MIDLFVVCAVDQDIANQIQTAKPRCIRATYDSSVVEALRRSYRKVSLVSIGEDNADSVNELIQLRPDVVFNLALASHPFEASFPGLLDILGFKYTGSSPRGVALANDKTRSRHLLKAAGIRVPRFVQLTRGQPATIDITPPLLVKPESLASSLGIYDDSLVMTPDEARKRAERIWERFDTPALCDEFVVGREFRISLIETAGQSFRTGGIIEWRFGTAAPGWGFRTEAMRMNSRVQRSRKVTRDLAVLPAGKTRELTTIARTAMKALDLQGYSTMDVRMTDEGQLTVLEVNVNPGLWSDSKLWNIPSFERTLKKIVDAALRREKVT